MNTVMNWGALAKMYSMSLYQFRNVGDDVSQQPHDLVQHPGAQEEESQAGHYDLGSKIQHRVGN